ncbi:3'-5' exonuclease [Saccharomonospora iraqiensis]|uniref:3'-5' exonuclease n=1 Tax=Saccharomonospora iraqiensis TaxID=52698 RepID=UPI00022E18D5|nr:3'-5' exonuclease [Saccharomonospora iraqiensis]
MDGSNGFEFVAIDVETANPKRGSICSVGLTVVENGAVTGSRSWLCRPPAPLVYFERRQVAIHGIDERRVADAPSFGAVLGDVRAAIGDRPVVAHNAAFDLGALRAACEADDTDPPTLGFGCTRVWTKRELDLADYRLPTVAGTLGVPLLRHHDAAEDARACAEVLLTLAAKRGSRTVHEFARATGTTLGRLGPGTWDGCRVVPGRG